MLPFFLRVLYIFMGNCISKKKREKEHLSNQDWLENPSDFQAGLINEDKDKDKENIKTKDPCISSSEIQIDVQKVIVTVKKATKKKAIKRIISTPVGNLDKNNSAINLVPNDTTEEPKKSKFKIFGVKFFGKKDANEILMSQHSDSNYKEIAHSSPNNHEGVTIHYVSDTHYDSGMGYRGENMADYRGGGFGNL